MPPIQSEIHYELTPSDRWHNLSWEEIREMVLEAMGEEEEFGDCCLSEG